MKLVIMDDDIALLNALSRRFSQRGFNVIAISEPATTQQLVNENADTYLLDLRFASQSGLNFVAPLRRALPKCRIVLLTGYASIANAVQAVKLGADDYLTKPADLLQLEQVLRGEHLASERATEDKPTVLSPDQLEWEHINRVLAQQDGNISRTAELLGMHRRTLQRKLSKHRP